MADAATCTTDWQWMLSEENTSFPGNVHLSSVMLSLDQPGQQFANMNIWITSCIQFVASVVKLIV